MRLLIVPITFMVIAATTVAHAEKVCMRYNSTTRALQKRVVTTGSCPRRFIEVVDTALLVGPQGPAGTNGVDGTNGANGTNGAPGEDGAVRVWGDGSAGNYVVSTSRSYGETNPQFINFEVQTGQSLAVVSGTTIRAMGTCTINGEITVYSGAAGGRVTEPSATTLAPSRLPANRGLAYRSPAPGEYGTNVDVVPGGVGGQGLTNAEARTLTRLIGVSFGSGGEAGAGSVAGGSGGGGIALYCKGGIEIGAAGQIRAAGGNGSSGSGGGAGGLIILASETSVVNSGSIQAAGGRGGNSLVSCAAGGGGGGGIIHVLAPSITIGTTNVSGGSGGNSSTSTSSSSRFGGAGGGGFGGDGGTGSTVLADNTPTAASSGTDGFVVQSLLDPTSLLM